MRYGIPPVRSRKEAIKQLGGFDEELLSFQDLDLHVRALIAGLKHFPKV